MPRILSEQEFNDIRSRVLQAAPNGLDEAGFHRYIGPAMEQALGEAENTNAAPQGSAIGRFAQNAWDAVNPIEGVKSLIHAATNQHEAAANLAESAKDQFQKAMNAFRLGRYSEAAGHGAAAALPIVGPAAANAGEQIASGDVAGGLGKGTGLVANVVGPTAVANKAAGVVDSVQRGLRSGAERIINSNVKPPASLVGRNPGVNIPRVILDEKFSPGFKGVEQGRQLSGQLGNEVNQLALDDAATGRKYPLDPVKQRLETLRDSYSQNPAGEGDVAAVQGVINELLDNPNYATPATKPTTVQAPHPTAVGNNGQPLMQAITQPGQPARLIPQDASAINTMKRRIYEENPASYGERKGARIQAEKTEGSALKGILDQNVSGVEAVNARNAGVITARKALNKMGVREANKYPLGLMDLAALAAGTTGHLAAGPVGAAPALMAALLKHPTTAFPIARGVDSLGALQSPRIIAGSTAALAPVGNVIDAGMRPVTKEELERVKLLLGQQ
jgi:hypothetical protein